MNHPTLDQLGQLLAESLGPDERLLVEQHVNGCDTCLMELDSLLRGRPADLRLLAELLLDPPAASQRPAERPEGSAGPELSALAAGPRGQWPTIPGHDVVEWVACGGMGEVYRARQRTTNRLVAVKTVRASAAAADPEHSERLVRFRTEVEAVSRLKHPNIITIYEVGEWEGRPYFTMEWIEQGTLAGQIRGTPWNEDAAARCVETLARAMHYAHQRGIVHRDLKPANVLLTFGREPPASAVLTEDALARGSRLDEAVPKITDFGLAKLLDERTALTRPWQMLGTPEYMAPEQASTEPGSPGISPLVDVYALGAILYELLTGRPPFKSNNPVETLRQVREDEPVSPRTLRPKLRRDLETITRKCLQKSPASRYATAADLADDLQRFVKGEPIHARPTGMFERTYRWCQRHPLPTALLILTVAASLLLWLVVEAFRDLRAQQVEQARHLAQLVDDQLKVVQHAVGISARSEELRQLLVRYEDDPAGQRRPLAAFLASAAHDFNKWFAWTGKVPLVNVFLLDRAGTIIADSVDRGGAVGRNFSERDYARPLRGNWPQGKPYVARVFRSHQDDLYKFAVVTGVYQDERLLAALAATLPIDSTMLQLDMSQQPAGALVACPLDDTYPPAKEQPEPSYLTVLHAGQARPGAAPERIGPEVQELLRALDESTQKQRGRLVAGEYVDCARVGDTPFVAVVRHPDRWRVGFLWESGVVAVGGMLVALGAGAFIMHKLWRVSLGRGRQNNT